MTSTPAPIILVHLRRPDRSKPNESRTDPMYEFGCFGLTGCHNDNLLNGTGAANARLGFIQPGPNAMRLVFLTPPVQVVNHGKRTAAHWSPVEMPLRFKDSVILIDNEGNTEVPSLKEMIKGVQRPTWISRFSSKFRSRTEPLQAAIAAEVVAAWEARIANAERATKYWEALPYMPPKPDTDRKATYERKLAEARGEPIAAESPPVESKHPRKPCS